MGSSPIRSIQSVSDGALAPSRQNFENWPLAELIGDFPPNERFFESEATVDSDDSGVVEGRVASDFRHDFPRRVELRASKPRAIMECVLPPPMACLSSKTA